MLEFWRQGSTPVPCTEIGRIARELEDAGWDGLCVGEAHGILPDPYMVLSLAAAATTRLRVGTAVAVPLREPMLAADAMLTLQAVSGGRAAFSVGRGDGAVKVVGRPSMSVAHFTTYVAQLQGLLRGETIAYLGGHKASLKHLLEVDPSLAAVPKPPIDIAATGPRMIEAGARLGESVSFAVGADLDRLRQGIERARAARAAAGLDVEALNFGCYVQIAVTGERTRAEARDAIRALVFTHSRFSAYHGEALGDVGDADREAFRGIIRASNAEWEGGAEGTLLHSAATLEDELLDRFAIVGSPHECAERIQAIEQLGITRFYLGTTSVFADESNAMLVGRNVLPLVRRELSVRR